MKKSVFVLAMALVFAWAGMGMADVTPPDLTVCDDIEDPCDAPTSICSNAGFKISLAGYEAATTSNGGAATYTYQICSPPPGTCTGSLRFGESCLDNSFCQSKGQATDPTATCTRECATDEFRALSHFDVVFPSIGTCVTENTQITGTCSNGNFVLGDNSCFPSGYPVAKCDNTSLLPGQCLTMTLSIAGETTGLGLGTAVVVDKEGSTCTASCLAGPSCDPCEGVPPGSECLTRTIGFWGTHPHIAGNYDPVYVCGSLVDGQAAGCASTSEALCFSAQDYKQNTPYLSLVAQLTAAKLNLNATAAIFSGGLCNTWGYGGKGIQQWIAECEASYCTADKNAISASMCIAALTAFNESQDTGFDMTPAPFDRPGPANPKQCQDARGNRKYIGGGLPECN